MNLKTIRDEVNKELAKNKDLSRRQLAVKMKIAPQSLNNYMDSETIPTMKNIEKIAKYFGKPVSYFVEGPPSLEDTEKGETISNHLRRESDRKLEGLIKAATILMDAASSLYFNLKNLKQADEANIKKIQYNIKETSGSNG